MKNKVLVVPFVLLLCFTFGCQDKEAMAELEELFIRIWFFDALSESAFSMRFSPPTIVGKYR
jgi:hypothetical protein